ATEHVGPAARRERQHHADRLLRVFLGCGGQGCGERNQAGRETDAGGHAGSCVRGGGTRRTMPAEARAAECTRRRRSTDARASRSVACLAAGRATDLHSRTRIECRSPEGPAMRVCPGAPDGGVGDADEPGESPVARGQACRGRLAVDPAL
ncbi:MAG: hypothetical protein ACK559_16170, partial [bacterium]